MTSNRIAKLGASFLGSLVFFGTVAIAWPSRLGLVLLLFFGVAGIASLVAALGIARRRSSVAFGVFMLVCAGKFGLSLGDFGLPRWSKLVLTSLLILSAAWFMREALRDASVGTQAA